MSKIEFTVNGKICAVDESTPRETTLNAYLRYVLALSGTKSMCHEGGCGSCIVMVRARRFPSGLVETFSVNSCLVLVFSCNGWEVTTIEGVGNRLVGYSDVQKRLVAFNGTQCGYCTPGWVMQLTSLLDKNLTMAELEQSFGSNTCRCTGFRPILETIKSFAIDASPEVCQKVRDIEELNPSCKTSRSCHRQCSTKSDCCDWTFVDDVKSESTLSFNFGKYKFFKVYDVNAIFDILNEHGVDSYMLVDGNTGKGIVETFDYPRLLMDISNVSPLKTCKFDQNLILGANMSLQDCIKIFKEAAVNENGFAYLGEFVKHLELIAHVSVRNIGSIAGNLMYKRQIPTYKSDMHILFECVGARVTVRFRDGRTKTLKISEFLKFDMQGVLLVNVELPPLSSSYVFRSYKIMPRSQNSLALVHSAYLLKIGKKNEIERASIVYGNINPNVYHASKTEKYLIGKNIFNDKNLQEAIKVLSRELVPVEIPGEPSTQFRKKLAVGLFYKFILNISPAGTALSKYASGGELLKRPVSSGKEDYQTDCSLYPLNQPVNKLEALIQVGGEAKYANDLPPSPGEVFGAFVLSKIHIGEVDTMDVEEVMAIDGVIALYTAKDIPGVNSFTFPDVLQLQTHDEEILATKIKFYGQPIAIIVAVTEKLAEKVAKLVKVTYKNVSTAAPVLTIDEAKKDSSRYVPGNPSIEPTGRGDNVTKIIKGVYEMESQYHYFIEPLSCVVVPVDKTLEVYDSAQWMDITQNAIARSLGINESEVLVKVRRIGGGFGGKISRNAQVATACALVAKKLDRTCRFILPMQTNMAMGGKRIPCQCEYEVGVNDDGEIQYLNASIVEDSGSSNNENILDFTVGGFPNCYDTKYWSLKTATVTTDTPSTSFVRAPGNLEGKSCIEHIMQHIAFTVQKDPTSVRRVNMRSEDNDLPELIDILKNDANYDQRAKEIEQFNKTNRWMKKAISINVMCFPVIYYGNYSALVSIYRGDGTVTVSTGGIEMGQGVNTKAAQVCAYELGVPLEYVNIVPNYSFVAANNVFSGASIATESVCYSIIRACEPLKERLAPIKESMPGASWKEMVQKAGDDQVELTSLFMMKDTDENLKGYSAFGVCIVETQLDVTTGLFQIVRADILEDVGISANPKLDVGQIQGAYIMGQGYYTCEKLIYDKETGKLLTNRSLTYHVPLALDIPVEFNVKLRYNSTNPKGVLGSKTCGEMGICLSHGVTHALRQCIMESRKDSGYDPNEWITILDESTPRETTLNAYLRYVLALSGTKSMCHEGGCGSCIVMVRARRFPSGLVETFSVNSCLVLVFSCNGWEVTTIEGVGNRLVGYSDVQKRLVAFNGTQCGYCTPGWVMQLTSLLDKNLTMAELEQSFGSNTCRCTGFRPILETIKSFAIDASPEVCQKVRDIEELNPSCKTSRSCHRQCSTKSDCCDWTFVDDVKSESTLSFNFGKYKFFKVYDVNAIFDILNEHGVDSYMLVDGNTGKGTVETFDYPRLLMDISNVSPLKTCKFDQNLILGANMSLQDCIKIFKEAAVNENGFAYLGEFVKHLELIAHVSVRNIGSIAGNLMYKRQIPTYKSDMHILFECVGARVTVRFRDGRTKTLKISEFLKFDMQGVLLVNVELPPLSSSYVFRSYKIMPRSQNSLALVHSAYLLKIGKKNEIERASIVYGNINPNVYHASKTEKYLIGKNIFNDKNLQEAIKVLSRELVPVEIPGEPSTQFRKKFAVGLFYKFILNISPAGTALSKYASGGELLKRPVSSGKEDYQTDCSLYPLNQPVNKLEALIQVGGEAKYANDLPPSPGEVFGAFVLSKIHIGEVDTMDVEEVMAIDGVIALYTAKDIPGVNSFTFPDVLQLQTHDEEILATKIKFYGQPIAIIVAVTEKLAEKVAKLVKVTYKNVSTAAPVLTIDEAKKDSSRYVPGNPSIEPTGRGDNVTKIIKGVYEMESQYHYFIEPLSCVVVPVDKTLEVYDSAQWMDITQNAIARSLGINESEVLVKVRRIGGGFGGKISRNAQVATACALVAKKLDRTCRFILPMQTNMAMGGKRIPCQCEYEVGVNDDGEIQYLNASIVEDSGSSNNENILDFTVGGFPNCYDTKYWSLKTATVTTDTPSTSFVRAPGNLEGKSCIEHIMQHIAFTVQKDPTSVRRVNMRSEDNDLPELIDILKNDANYDQRAKEIEQFNKTNRWMKKAISINVMCFPVIYYGNYSALVSIYRGDGTVTVSTGGIEMGQGVNTKAAQVCAYELGVPLEYVNIVPNYSFVAANNVFSGASIATESVCYSIIRACEPLKERLAPIKESMPGASWKEMVQKAGDDQVELTSLFMMKDTDENLKGYSAFGVCIVETQLDVTTGLFQIVRADILEDVGISANPKLDVGQIQGAYIMGQGYYTCEKLIYDKETGKLLTNRSLTYHVPLALDIPVEFNVKLRYNSTNPKGVLGSKTCGEMGICLSHGVTHALRQCIMESRKDSGYDPNEWITIPVPYEAEVILKALNVKPEEFLLSK